MLMPKRTKYRKPHRLSYEGKTKGNKELAFGEYGLMAKEGGYVSAKQIEAARIAMTRYMKRGGKVWINIFPQLARTQKPLETRQGTGKGDVKEWVAVVKEGRIMFEVANVSEEIAREALRLASHKLSVKTSEIRKMNKDEINSKIVELKKELFDLRMKQAVGNLDKPHKINALRKDVARLKTILAEKDGSEE